MTIGTIIALLKAIPETAASRAEAAAEIAQDYGWTMTCTDENSDGNVVITKSN